MGDFVRIVLWTPLAQDIQHFLPRHGMVVMGLKYYLQVVRDALDEHQVLQPLVSVEERLEGKVLLLIQALLDDIRLHHDALKI